ncbi:hypothetical protein TcBrA4_0105760 [Trypanosoma cruzi]|nr:hypothetical protein TcBrA4_0105760 [Trypanosoma cruzi]
MPQDVPSAGIPSAATRAFIAIYESLSFEADGNLQESNGKNKRQVTLYEVKKGSRVSFTSHDKAIHASRKRQRMEKLPLEERLRRMSAKQ